jgi:hypothetical protein
LWKRDRERPKENSTLVRPRRKWVDNIKMDLRENNGMAWIGLM